MPSLKEIIERENSQRVSLKDIRTVRLTKLGNFIRAYDWSAWLLKRQGSTLNVGLDSTDGTQHLFVGFPVASIEKFQPQGSAAVKDEEGTPTEWIFNEENFPAEDSLDELEKTYQAWFSENVERLMAEQVEKKEKRRAKSQSETTEKRRGTVEDDPQESRSARPLRLTDIARDILRFRVEQHSPVACAEYLKQVQEDILNLL